MALRRSSWPSVLRRYEKSSTAIRKRQECEDWNAVLDRSAARLPGKFWKTEKRKWLSPRRIWSIISDMSVIPSRWQTSMTKWESCVDWLGPVQEEILFRLK